MNTEASDGRLYFHLNNYNQQHLLFFFKGSNLLSLSLYELIEVLLYFIMLLTVITMALENAFCTLSL